MTDTPTSICRNCPLFQLLGDAPPLPDGHEQQAFGSCRANPPKADGPDYAGSVTGYFPTVRAASWCGAHPGRRLNLDGDRFDWGSANWARRAFWPVSSILSLDRKGIALSVQQVAYCRARAVGASIEGAARIADRPVKTARVWENMPRIQERIAHEASSK